MAVPEQVRKQTEAVQALYDDLNPSTETPSAGQAEGISGDVVNITPANTADSVSNDASTPEPTEQGEGNQENPNSETYEQRWRTAQGMYNAEVPRLQAQVQELTQRGQQMEQLVATMQTAPPAAAQAAPPVSSLTAEEVDEYGESIDIMRKVSQEVSGQYQKQIADMQSTINELRGTIVPRVEQIGNAQAQSAEQRFWSDIDSMLPNWRDINDNQDFQSWLLEVDPLSGISRQTYLDDAQRNQDSRRVASFFTSWQSATGAAVAQPNRSNANSELERQITPGKGRSGGTTPVGESKTYTAADLTAFYTKVREGKFEGQKEKRDAIERDIFAAQRDGRIVQA